MSSIRMYSDTRPAPHFPPAPLRRLNLIFLIGYNMTFKEYGKFDAVGLAQLVRIKEVKPKELLGEAIARTEKVDPHINAVVVKHYDYAERQIEKEVPAGPFAGVPFI